MAQKLVFVVATAAAFAVIVVLWPWRAEIKQEPSTGPKMDLDVEAAKARLSQYERVFADKSELFSPVDPLDASTVTNWWQAAALIHSYSESKPRYKCRVQTRFGNWAACMDPPYTIKPPCLVYSFGIAFDFSFDDAMAKHGCTVHSFDPSMKTKSHRRSERVMFHNLGLSSHNTDSHVPMRDPLYVRENQTWSIRTLSSIKRMLGHTGVTI